MDPEDSSALMERRIGAASAGQDEHAPEPSLRPVCSLLADHIGQWRPFSVIRLTYQENASSSGG